ncbi:DUF1648 domain-containing protein [Planococcus versutus]|uniref:DUF1648 domain-containing protein n=1 Tax=Planococcus versutus TaxID=1302659 RepID=A0A1B1RX23_9BACL|nr:DUF1648 domain-containing protein [Planococcus versutus]ANU25479.1 hypothetical protein I858_000100 [Planococcus versutus]
MNKQQKIALPRSVWERFFDKISLILFLSAVLYVITKFGSTPAQVPVHYDGTGKVDSWGSKSELFILPLVGVFLWIGMTILEKYPHTYNYLNLKEDNRETQYKNGRLMVNVLKNEIVILFSFIIVQDIRIAIGTAEGLGIFFVPIYLVIIFSTVLFFIIRMLRN